MQLACQNTANQYANFDIQNGVVGAVGSDFSDAKIEDYGNGWYRCSAVSTNRYTTVWVSLISGLNGGWLESWAMPNNTDGIYIWGAQVEEKSFSTSLIPTFGAARTRLRDLATNSGNATLINSTEGVLYFEASILDDSDSNKYISLSDGTNSNIVQVDFDYSSSRLQYVVKSSSATVVNIKIPYTGTNMDKFAMKWKENDFAIWRNGIEIGADATGVAPLGLKVLKLTHPNVGSSNHFFGKIKALAVYKEALTDEELQYLTTQ